MLKEECSFIMKSNFQALADMIKQLFYILNKQQKRSTVRVLFVITVGSFFELLGVTAILPFVEVVVSPEKVWKNQYIAKIVPVFHITNVNQLLMMMGIALICIYIVKNLVLVYANYVQYDFATRLQKELSCKMLQSYMSRPYTFFINANSSLILRGCSNDVQCVYNIVDYLITILAQALNALLIGIFLIYTDSIIAVGAIGLMVFVLLGIVLIFRPTIKRAGKRNMELFGEQNKILLQISNGIKEILVSQRKEYFLDAYGRVANQGRKVSRTYSVLNATPDKIVEAVCVSGVIGIVCVRLVNNSMDMLEFVPKLAAFAMAAFKLLPSIGKITNRINGIIYFRPGLRNVYHNMTEANYHVENIQKYVRRKESIIEYPTNLEFKQEIAINHILWQYENQKKPVLNGVQLTINKGEAVAFIGASGAGKTTLSDVVLGLLKPIRGTVEMDGIDVYTIPMQWAHIVGYVPQSVFLMDDTVRNNIAFGLPSDMIDDQAIWKALEMAQLKEFIEGLPYGLDTLVGERGIKFSGGQRQRIAIARALYSEPQILVLDEATASLDNETETAVMESIDRLQGQITMIIVAHRLTTIRNCDKIYEIKDGVALERSKQEIFG